MRGDYTRFTFEPHKRFTSVLLQQGRVQLDSDWNELSAINTHRQRTEASDVIGICGAPEDGGGFAIEGIAPGTADLRITNGRIYVAGLLCELDPERLPVTGFPTANKIELPSATLDGRPVAANQWLELSADGVAPELFQVTNVDETTITLSSSPGSFDPPAANPVARRVLTYMTQPDLPSPPPPVAGRTDLMYLDVWQRHVTAVEDPQIREEALLGPDTATRIQTICQVRLAPNNNSCDNIDDLTATLSGGRLSTRATPGSDDENLCLVPPGGGYTALENRLYRVEIHDEGDLGVATYKWSRYNGAVAFPVARFEATATDRIWLGTLGEDEVLGLSLGDWVEVLDDDTELAGETGTLVRVDGIDPGERSITITPAIPAATFAVARHARVRRWDEDVAADGFVTTAPGWNALENGVEIRFGGEDFKAGDYWAFAARTNTGRVDVLTEAPPRNVDHHLCPLAVVQWSAAPLTATVLDDCRPPFVSLTDLLAQRVLRYVAGDGQEARPGALLQGDLIVGVEDGLGRPVEDYDVVFTVSSGAGNLEPGTTSPITVATDANGLSTCRWRLGPDPDDLQEVTAALATTPSPQDESLPVIFRAGSHYLSLRYLSGDGQSGRAAALLPAPLVVGVEDAGGRPVAGVEVSFTVTAGGGFADDVGTTPTAATFNTTTDPSGIARADWLLGPDPDVDQRVTVALRQIGPPPADLQDDALELVFNARPYYLSLRYITGDGREGKPDDILTDPPLAVGVEDGEGRPVADVDVIFTPSGGAGVRAPGGGAFSNAAITVSTDPQGVARCELQLGSADGVYTTTATLDPALQQDDSLAVIFRAVAESAIAHGTFPTVRDISWTNDGPLQLADLNAGLKVRFSTKMSPLSLKKTELFVVTVELVERDPVGNHLGFRSHILHGRLSSASSGTVWTFTPVPQIPAATLTAWQSEYHSLHLEHVRLRVALKACGIFSASGQRYLDGEAYWGEGPAGTLGTLDHCGDGHEGGDFESWAFLVPPAPTPTPTATVGPTILPTVTIHPTVTLVPLPTGTLLPTATSFPTGTLVPTFSPTFGPTILPFGFGGSLALNGVEIFGKGGGLLTRTQPGEDSPAVAAGDEPASIELELEGAAVDDDSIAFAGKLRVVNADSGDVASASLQWLAGSRLRIELDEPLPEGEYVVLPEGEDRAEPSFSFRVT